MNRLLIVEDETVVRKQLVRLFQLENFEVAEADCGETGIEAAARVTPDLVVCDVMMPGTDGFGVLQALRKHPATALTPFIFLTAKAGGQDVRQGMGQGADDYITKPFDPEILVAAVRQRLARRSLQIQEAERRGTDSGMAAATALPREMEGCLTHLEAISAALAATFGDDRQAADMSRAVNEEVTRLRSLSQRLRLYGELPHLYGSRFATAETAPAACSHQTAVDAAQAVARQWARDADLQIVATPATVPLPAETLTLLVRELVDNSCKFSVPATPIVVEARPEQGYWKLTVSDQGNGMPADQIKNIGAFRQFWNGSDRPTGLGLGLVLVQTLTRLHSGELAIESAPGAGTRVTLMQPVQ